MGKKIDLTNKRFGRWTVLCETRTKEGRIGWVCRCDCGNTGVHRGYSLTSGHTKSCGCLKVEMHTTHGLSKNPSYKIWRGMMDRCYHDWSISWSSYGGRGIKVCQRWHDPALFIKDMGTRPDGMSIERIDVNGDYCPENCKWATDAEQRANMRTNRYLFVNGEKLHFNESARQAGLSGDALRRRLKLGWSLDDALHKPLRYSVANPQMILDGGKMVKLRDAAKSHGLTPAQVRFRLSSGWSAHDALNRPLRRQKRS